MFWPSIAPQTATPAVAASKTKSTANDRWETTERPVANARDHYRAELNKLGLNADLMTSATACFFYSPTTKYSMFFKNSALPDHLDNLTSHQYEVVLMARGGTTSDTFTGPPLPGELLRVHFGQDNVERTWKVRVDDDGFVYNPRVSKKSCCMKITFLSR